MIQVLNRNLEPSFSNGLKVSLRDPVSAFGCELE